MATTITLRAPSVSSKTSSSFTAPPLSFLKGTWHVTHSTLPMWRKAQDVAITYTPISTGSQTTSDAAESVKLDDLVTYRALGSSGHGAPKTVRGIDTPTGPGAWSWRGKGWLMIASSKWEVLGWGKLDDSDDDGGHAWVVTYFQKTLFTPAGLDVYSRKREGLPESCLTSIKQALAQSEDGQVKTLAEELFVVKTTGVDIQWTPIHGMGEPALANQ